MTDRKRSYEKYRREGRCFTCGKPSLPGFVQCATHKEQRRLYLRARYAKRKAAALCSFCAKPNGNGKRRCEACTERDKTYRAKAPKVNRTEYNKARRIARKTLVFEAYGGAFCNCCGETDLVFLTLDHINNDGGVHRKEMRGVGKTNIVSWLIKNNFPPGFQTLCFNCNCGRSVNGGICPHKSHATAMFNRPTNNLSVQVQ